MKHQETGAWLASGYHGSIHGSQITHAGMGRTVLEREARISMHHSLVSKVITNSE